ncbi:MAG: DUF4203 domain-containing protein [Planctomycetes bacterium]|nr:DUF4203 domain-containing protein [Planctomycetota bacterium]
MNMIHNPLSDSIHATAVNVERLIQRDIPLPWHAEPIAAVALLIGVVALLWGVRFWKSVLAVTGFAVGTLAGLCLRQVVMPTPGGLPPLLYALPCGLIVAMLFCFLDKILGFALGSALGLALAIPWIRPEFIHSQTGIYVATAAAFLCGGFLGLFFFRQFTVLFTSTTGALFGTYGLHHLFFTRVDAVTQQPNLLWGLTMASFLLLSMFGICSQALSPDTAGGRSSPPGGGKNAPPPAKA